MSTLTTESPAGLRAISPEREFKWAFPIIQLPEAEIALAQRFQAVGSLASVASFMAERDYITEYPELGVLNARFNVDGHDITATPMGANEKVLLGYFNLATLLRQDEDPKNGVVKELLGIDAAKDSSDVDIMENGYIALARRTNKAAGFGVSRYIGRVAAFINTPEDSELMKLARTVSFTSEDFPVARFDTVRAGGYRTYISI